MKNEPVTFWTSLGLLIGMIIQYALPDVSNEFVDLLVRIIAIVGPTLVGAFYARSQVTPLVNPRANDGEPLVPASYAYRQWESIYERRGDGD